MRVLILGGEGQLGKCFQTQLSPLYEVIAPPHSELDISDTVGVLKYNPSVIINCAASHDTSRSDVHVMSLVNSTPLIPLLQTIPQKTIFVQISTDHVFSKPGRHSERSQPFTSTVYGLTKSMGESTVMLHHRHIILRVSALYSPFPVRGKPRPSFVNQVLSAKDTMDVTDAVGCTPVYCPDVADMVVRLLEDQFFGTLHLVPSDMPSLLSFADFADRIVEVSKKPLIISRYGDRSGIVNLSTEYNYSMPPLSDSLRRYLDELSNLPEK